jgi:hypothetical protein
MTMSTEDDIRSDLLQQNLGPVIVPVILFFTVLTTLIVILRLYTRYFIVKHVFVEDVVIISALVRRIAL